MLLSGGKSRLLTNPLHLTLGFCLVLSAFWLFTYHRPGLANSLSSKVSDSISALRPGAGSASTQPPPTEEKVTEQQTTSLIVSDQVSTTAVQTSTSTSVAPTTTTNASTRYKTHPIKELHEAAKGKFLDRISQQSQSLAGAVEVYKRRYGRAPPQGFDDWYNYAKEMNSVIIDDFDTIDESMKPFWKVAPAKLRELVKNGQDAPRVMKMSIKGGEILPQEGDWMGEQIRDTLGLLAKKLPDLEFIINPLDEPRIIKNESLPVEEVKWVNLGQKLSFARITEPCKELKSSNVSKSTGEIKFVADLQDAQDICSHAEYETIHGFLISPDSFLTTDSPVPVLSQCRASTFSDVIYPSMWYYTHEIGDLANTDAKWADKKNSLYWVGRTTGGFNGEPVEGAPVRESHRHRFIKITRQLAQYVWNFLTRNKSDATWTSYQSDDILSQLYNTKFTGIVQCNGPHCETDKKKYEIQPEEKGMVGFKHRFLMDLDGNTFSGRFYNLLASNSCPLKQTIFKEWHDERLFPWVHYVPISVSLDELPETMRYLALTKEGSNIAQEIAHIGQEWNAKFLRREDAAVYLYRLFLEYGRVMSDDRDKMSFEIGKA